VEYSVPVHETALYVSAFVTVPAGALMEDTHEKVVLEAQPPVVWLPELEGVPEQLADAYELVVMVVPEQVTFTLPAEGPSVPVMQVSSGV
jgi:hypothetical protein